MDSIDTAMIEQDEQAQRFLARMEAEGEPGEGDAEKYARAHYELNASEAEVLAGYEFRSNALDENRAKLLSEIDRRRSGVEWKYKIAAEQEVIERTANRKARHVKTPYGMVGFRTKAARSVLTITDPQAAMRACLAKGADLVIQAEPRLDRPALKRAIERGASIEGASVEQTGSIQEFYVKTASNPKTERTEE